MTEVVCSATETKQVIACLVLPPTDADVIELFANLYKDTSFFHVTWKTMYWQCFYTWSIVCSRF